MDKQKSVENVGPSQSSSSRRVMWKVRDGDEEVYNSVVNYRSLSPSNDDRNLSSSDLEHEPASTSKPQTLSASDGKHRLLKEQKSGQTSANKSSTSLALRYKPSHESLQEPSSVRRARVKECWHHLFDRIRNKKLGNEAHATLALRYKPSHESLKNRRSKEQVEELSTSRSANSSKPKLATADLKLETCFFPPHQTAVVREVAPKFANRMCQPDDSDSYCSGSLDLRNPLLKSSKSRNIPAAIDKSAVSASASFHSHTEAKGRNSKGKRRTKAAAGSSNAATSKGNGNKPPTVAGTANPLPTLRQRQQELHRFRVEIEKRRLELLDLKIVRERADALRHEILFHKDLQLKHNQIKSYEDNYSSQA